MTSRGLVSWMKFPREMRSWSDGNPRVFPQSIIKLLSQRKQFKYVCNAWWKINLASDMLDMLHFEAGPWDLLSSRAPKPGKIPHLAFVWKNASKRGVSHPVLFRISVFKLEGGGRSEWWYFPPERCHEFSPYRAYSDLNTCDDRDRS